MSEWPAFDPQDTRIVSLGNVGFGAYCRAARHCEEKKTSSISKYDAAQIASDEVWSKIVSFGFAVPHGDRFRLVPLAEKTRKKKPTTVPDDFALDQKMYDFAASYGMPEPHIVMNFDRFVAHHQSKATSSADWHASWRTWVINQVTDFGRKPRPVRTAPLKQVPLQDDSFISKVTKDPQTASLLDRALRR